jgi:dipeptidyl aminopeptidase/acylaminoacyl peptidase
VYVHGASAFRADHWETTRPLRDAGFIVMTPILRGENGSPGAFSLFYDEVDDVLAAGEALAKLPGIDPTRIYLAGHSNGGTLVMLAAMTSTRFRAAAAFSGLVDASGLHGDPVDVPFDQTNADEFRMRSAIEFPASFKCPVRIYYGADEAYTDGFAELARRARALGRDVEAVRVPGDHDTMKAAALPVAIELFRHTPADPSR